MKLRLDVNNNANYEGMTKENFRGIDAAVEFSTPAAAPRTSSGIAGWALIAWSARPAGLERSRKRAEAVEAAGSGWCGVPNFSVGVKCFSGARRRSGAVMARQPEYGAWAWEIHHSTKKDAPSGTLLKLVEEMKQSGLRRARSTSAASRAGAIPGTHEIGFDSCGGYHHRSGTRRAAARDSRAGHCGRRDG